MMSRLVVSAALVMSWGQESEPDSYRWVSASWGDAFDFPEETANGCWKNNTDPSMKFVKLVLHYDAALASEVDSILAAAAQVSMLYQEQVSIGFVPSVVPANQTVIDTARDRMLENFRDSLANEKEQAIHILVPHKNADVGAASNGGSLEGKSWQNAACANKHSSGFVKYNEDNWHFASFLAHEIGHLLGANHAFDQPHNLTTTPGEYGIMDYRSAGTFGAEDMYLHQSHYWDLCPSLRRQLTNSCWETAQNVVRVNVVSATYKCSSEVASPSVYVAVTRSEAEQRSADQVFTALSVEAEEGKALFDKAHDFGSVVSTGNGFDAKFNFLLMPYSNSTKIAADKKIGSVDFTFASPNTSVPVRQEISVEDGDCTSTIVVEFAWLVRDGEDLVEHEDACANIDGSEATTVACNCGGIECGANTFCDASEKKCLSEQKPVDCSVYPLGSPKACAVCDGRVGRKCIAEDSAPGVCGSSNSCEPIDCSSSDAGEACAACTNQENTMCKSRNGDSFGKCTASGACGEVSAESMFV